MRFANNHYWFCWFQKDINRGKKKFPFCHLYPISHGLKFMRKEISFFLRGRMARGAAPSTFQNIYNKNVKGTTATTPLISVSQNWCNFYQSINAQKAWFLLNFWDGCNNKSSSHSYTAVASLHTLSLLDHAARKAEISYTVWYSSYTDTAQL